MTQREIKFRGWIKSKNKMEEVWQIDFVKKANSDKLVANEVSIDDELLGVDTQVILMQFTGLKDKNGKEIYEGDIVINQWGIREEVNLEPIDVADYENGWAGFGWVLETHSLEDIKEKVEVIGNIYENKELLK